MIDACPDSAVLFFDVDGTLTSFDPDDMTDKTSMQSIRRRLLSMHLVVCAMRVTRHLSARAVPCGWLPMACVR